MLCDAMKQLDLAAMMGGPRFRPLLDQVIAAVDHLLQQQQQQLYRGASTEAAACGPAAMPAAAVTDAATAEYNSIAAGSRPCSAAKRVRLTIPTAAAASYGDQPAVAAAASAAAAIPEALLPRGSLSPESAVVPVLCAPSLEQFLTEVLMAPGQWSVQQRGPGHPPGVVHQQAAPEGPPCLVGNSLLLWMHVYVVAAADGFQVYNRMMFCSFLNTLEWSHHIFCAEKAKALVTCLLCDGP
jgi:hypothetical protein